LEENGFLLTEIFEELFNPESCGKNNTFLNELNRYCIIDRATASSIDPTIASVWPIMLGGAHSAGRRGQAG
jgi:hypothetical protein